MTRCSPGSPEAPHERVIDLIAWKLGRLEVLAVPGEGFHGVEEAIRRVHADPLLIAGLAPDWHGYFPVPVHRRLRGRPQPRSRRGAAGRRLVLTRWVEKAHGFLRSEQAGRRRTRASSSTPASTCSTATGARCSPSADDAERATSSRTRGRSTPQWHLGLTEGATDETKARYAFVYGDLRRVHRTGLIACVYRASEWRHKDVELAAHDLLQHLDKTSG